MFRLPVAAIVTAGIFFIGGAHAQPLDQIIDFNAIPPAGRSLLDPVKRANYDEYSLLAQRADTLGRDLSQDRSRYMVRAARFVKIPQSMSADDVVKAWEHSGGSPRRQPAVAASLYVSASDETHFVSDVVVGTGFVCSKPGYQEPQDEIWARHFYFVTVNGELVDGEPPKCR